MKDWKGNEIEVGMEICLVSIIQRQCFRAGILLPIDYGGHIEWLEDVTPDQECWIPGPYYKVINETEISRTVENATFVWPLEQFVGMSDMELNVLAIKGISDQNPKQLK